MRRKLLETGELKERVITVPELKKAAAVCPRIFSEPHTFFFLIGAYVDVCPDLINF